MGLLSRAWEQRSTLSQPAQWFKDWASGGVASATGVAVTEESAMRTSAVYACVDIIARNVASLPLPVYERLTTGGKQKAPKHPLYRVLHDVGNYEMTAMTVRQTLQAHAALRGNAFAEIEFDRAGDAIGLWPLRPDQTRLWRDPETRQLWYITTIDGKEYALPFSKVFHLPGLSGDGYTGYSPIRQAAQTIGLTLALDQYGGAFFGNGAKPGGVIQVPRELNLTEPAKARLQTSWETRHEGLTRAHRVAVLDEGMTYQQIGIAPEEAQFLETRKFQVADIARIFHVPPHMIGDLERSTNNNIEHQGLEFVKYTLRPWLVQWEQSIVMKLLRESERERYFAEHLVDGLLRGDAKARHEAYRSGFNIGMYSLNQLLEFENLNPIGPEGDKHFVPLNMAPVDMVEELLRKQGAKDAPKGGEEDRKGA